MKGLIWKLICPLDWEWCKPLGTESAFSINGVNIPLLEKPSHFIIGILFWDFLEILDKLVTCLNTLCFAHQVRFRSRLQFFEVFFFSSLTFVSGHENQEYAIFDNVWHYPWIYIHTVINLYDIWMKLWKNLTNLDHILV